MLERIVLFVAIGLIHAAHTLLGVPMEGIEQALIAMYQERQAFRP